MSLNLNELNMYRKYILGYSLKLSMLVALSIGIDLISMINYYKGILNTNKFLIFMGLSLVIKIGTNIIMQILRDNLKTVTEGNIKVYKGTVQSTKESLAGDIIELKDCDIQIAKVDVLLGNINDGTTVKLFKIGEKCGYTVIAEMQYEEG